MKPFKTNLDIYGITKSTYWDIVQGDTNAYPCEFTILAKGKPYDMSTGVWTATITWVRANKTTVLTGAEKIQLDGNVLKYTLESNVYAVAGALVASVELYKDGSRLTTCQFTAKVREQLSDGTEIPAQDEYNILLDLLAKVETSADQASQAKEDAESAVESLNGMKGTIQGWLDNPEQFKGDKGDPGEVTQAEFDALEDDFIEHKNDYATYVARTDPFAIYGVSWNKSSNPTLTRTDSAVGFIANVGVDDEVVQNEFDRTQIFGEIHDVEDSLGNVFVRIPKFYIRKTDSPTLKTWQISKTKYKGFYLPWCFWDFEKGIELPYIDIGKHKASLSLDNKLESKPDTAPLVSRNIVQFREYARANNVNGLMGYQQLDIHAYDVILTLFYIEFATLNSQSIMQGFTTGRYGVEADIALVSESNTNRIIVSNATAAQYRVGQTISVGTARYGTQVFYGRTITAIEDYDAANKAIVFDGAPVNVETGNMLQNTGAVSGFSSKILASSGSIGSNSDGKYPCMYRGIESPYGDMYQFVDGININDLQVWVALNATDYASNVFASPYKELGYLNAPANGYIKEMGFDSRYPFAEFPIEIGAGASTYYADYYYQNTGQRIARVGGLWNIGAPAGLSLWSLNSASSNAYVSIGGRLLRKPL